MSDPSLFAQRRLLPSGSLTTGSGLAAAVMATVATVLLVLAAVSIALLIGVACTSGERTISGEEFAALGEALGERFSPLEEVGAGAESPRSIRLSNAGVVPLLLRGDYIGPGWLIGLAKTFPALLQSSSAIGVLCIASVVFLIGQHLLELGAGHAASKIGIAAGKRVRGAIHRQALRINLGDLDGKARRLSHSLFTKQVDSIVSATTDLSFHLVRDPVRIGLCAIVALSVDWRLTILVFVPLVAAWLVIESERTRRTAQQRLAESRAVRALRLLAEALSKARLIRGYGMEKAELDQFDQRLETYSREVERGVGSWRGRQRISWGVAIAVGGLVAYLVAMKVIADPTFAVSSGVIFGLLLAVCLLTLLRSRGVVRQWQDARTASAQINRFLDQIPDVSQAVGAKFLEPVEKAITFESVKLERQGRVLFENLELKLEAGTRTAFVSLDPAEARAAAFLLPRFLEPDAGRILFDGEDIAWGTLESLRAECCYVGGREPFFTGTISENISAGDSFTDTEILEAATQCHVHKSITQLSDGYETLIGEHGQSLPPGHAFLLGLTRAIIRDPAIIIIEEPDCDLDEDTKASIEDAYMRTLKGRTVVFLPRRLSTVRRADNVVLFSEGSIRAIGTQRRLVVENELYRHWEYTTFSPFGRQQRRIASVDDAIAEFESAGV